MRPKKGSLSGFHALFESASEKSAGIIKVQRIIAGRAADVVSRRVDFHGSEGIGG